MDRNCRFRSSILTIGRISLRDTRVVKICVLGMGYVGCVSAVCLAESGHDVIGVDVSASKLALLAEARSPIVEPGIDELIARHVRAGRFRVTDRVDAAIAESDVSLICVGTPGQQNGSLDLRYVRAVCADIGRALRGIEAFHTVVVRSTMLPGTIHETVIPALESASGKASGKDFAVAINPEFLREGTAIRDFTDPPFTLAGSDDPSALDVLREIYAGIDAPLLETSVREAEMVKYACNCFHAVKVSFANEIGNICKAGGIDSHVVMDALCRDTKLNLSPYYLKPGFAFGGSCLPKDLRAINYKARQFDLETPLLSSVLVSNERQVATAYERIARLGLKRVTLLGLSFKSGTDDLRESPMVTLAERLIGRGFDLTIYDREVEMARLVGANKSYIDSEIPHLSRLLTSSLAKAIESAQIIVVAKKDAEYAASLLSLAGDRPVLDLARLDALRQSLPGYDGLCW